MNRQYPKNWLSLFWKQMGQAPAQTGGKKPRAGITPAMGAPNMPSAFPSPDLMFGRTPKRKAGGM